jgi:DNA-binding transcriptional LysR family regulator
VPDRLRNMDWDKLRIFHAVAEAGSFTHAGEALSLSQSAISRQISALEESLKTPLFHRHARGLLLTEQGELLYRTVHEMSGRLAMAEAQLTDRKDRPTGELKVTATVAFGSIWVAPRIKAFIEKYPDVTMALHLDDGELDLSMREADVALRMWKPTQPDLVYRKLLTVHNHIYASPDYLRQHGTPQSIEDIDRHRLIVYGEEVPAPLADVNWLLQAGATRKKLRNPTLRINNMFGVRQAVESGLGIAALPDYIVQGNPEIVRILPEVEGPAFDTYFVYPEELRHSKRIAVFRDYLISCVADWRF